MAGRAVAPADPLHPFGEPDRLAARRLAAVFVARPRPVRCLARRWAASARPPSSASAATPRCRPCSRPACAGCRRCCTSRTPCSARPTACVLGGAARVATSFARTRYIAADDRARLSGRQSGARAGARAAQLALSRARRGPRHRSPGVRRQPGRRFVQQGHSRGDPVAARAAARARCASCSNAGPRISSACARPMPRPASWPSWRRSSPTCRSGWPAAHLVIGRSGASTVAELATIGRPSILIPYPYAADDHQTRQCPRLRGGGRLHRHSARRVHGRRAGRRICRRCSRRRSVWPRWPPPRTPPAGPMLPRGLPISSSR